MKDREFQLREITYKSKEYPNLFEVTRSRNNHGSSAITIRFQKLTLRIDSGDEDIGNHYEQIAFELARTIEQASEDNCFLPKTSEKEGGEE